MVSAQGIVRSLRPLTAAEAMALPGQLGVYEIVDGAGVTTRIAAAGALEPFGLRSAVRTEFDRVGKTGDFTFRYECTHGYMTRWQELLMLHVAEHGKVPVDNTDDAHRIGRLS